MTLKSKGRVDGGFDKGGRWVVGRSTRDIDFFERGQTQTIKGGSKSGSTYVDLWSDVSRPKRIDKISGRNCPWTWGCVDRVERTSTNYERNRPKSRGVKERWGDNEV